MQAFYDLMGWLYVHVSLEGYVGAILTGVVFAWLVWLSVRDCNGD